MKNILKNDYVAIVLLGLAQGLLSTLSLAPFNFPLLVWFAPWPLFYFSKRFRNNVRKLLLSGAVSAFFLCLFAFYWMFYMFGVYGGMNLIFSVLIFIPYTVVLNLKSPLFVLLFGLACRKKFRNRLPARAFTAAFLALFTDFLTPQIFPWYWGNLVAGNFLLVQTAEITGIHGMTFLMFFVSYFLYQLLQAALPALRGRNRKNRGRAAALARLFGSAFVWKRIYPAPLLLLVCLSFGAVRKHQLEKLQATLPSVRVAVVNPNSPLEQYGAEQITYPVIRDLMYNVIPSLTAWAQRSSEGKLDLVVLPESAVPYLSAENTVFNIRRGLYSPDLEVMLQLIAYNWNVDVFFNDITIQGGKDILGAFQQEPYNSSALYSRDGKRRDRYDKRRLLAFGEYIPGIDFLKKTGLIRLVPEIVRSSRFFPGRTSNLIPYSVKNRESPHQNATPLHQDLLMKKSPRDFEKEFPPDRTFAPDGYFMPLICYEVLFPDHVRSFFGNPQKRNPDFMVNITQDGWYGDTVETYQHYELGRIRAVETRRALVRSVNNGAAGFVDLAGNYVTPLVGPVMTKPQTRDFQVWDVPINREFITLYTRFGNLWLILPLLIFVGLVVWRAARRVA